MTSGESPQPAAASSQQTVDAPEAAFDKLAEIEVEETKITRARTVWTVDAQVKGAEGTFVVDTSASNHVLTREFAESHDIIFTEPTETLEGEAARGRAPTAAVETTTLTVGGDRIEADEMLAKPRAVLFPDLPEVERQSQLAGVLSPQNLYDAANRYTTLNLAENKIVAFEARPNGVKAWLRVEFGKRTFETIERREVVAPELPQVVAQVNGNDETAVVLLDSSASETVFRSTDVHVADEQMTCIEGDEDDCDLRGALASGQTVEFGGVESPEFTAVGTTSTLEKPGVDGIIGHDAMEHFVWVFPADDDKPVQVARAETTDSQ